MHFKALLALATLFTSALAAPAPVPVADTTVEAAAAPDDNYPVTIELNYFQSNQTSCTGKAGHTIFHYASDCHDFDFPARSFTVGTAQNPDQTGKYCGIVGYAKKGCEGQNTMQIPRNPRKPDGSLRSSHLDQCYTSFNRTVPNTRSAVLVCL